MDFPETHTHKIELLSAQQILAEIPQKKEGFWGFMPHRKWGV